MAVERVFLELALRLEEEWHQHNLQFMEGQVLLLPGPGKHGNILEIKCFCFFLLPPGLSSFLHPRKRFWRSFSCFGMVPASSTGCSAFKVLLSCTSALLAELYACIMYIMHQNDIISILYIHNHAKQAFYICRL